MAYNYSRDRDDRDDDAPTASAQLTKLGKDVHSALYELKTAVDDNVHRVFRQVRNRGAEVRP
jgi:hypothetical protein